MRKAEWLNGGKRTAIVKGLRTPFEKAGTLYSRLTALDRQSRHRQGSLCRRGARR